MESMVVKRSAPSLEHGRRVKIIMREAIMMLIMAVCVGYLMMWVMTGTHIYKTWFGKILVVTNSTYFGFQGPTILVYTFPVLFIAVMSCVYLHLGKQVSDNSTERCNGKTHKFGSWKRPMIIKGLGIVCGIELAMFVMFIALLVWSFSAYLHIFFSEVRRQVMQKDEKIRRSDRIRSELLSMEDDEEIQSQPSPDTGSLASPGTNGRITVTVAAAPSQKHH